MFEAYVLNIFLFYYLIDTPPAAEKGAAAFEACMTDDTNPHSLKKAKASEGVNLVMTSAKSFAQRGCDKSGI